ncbi:4-diphosphocytidyl-2-C-methyl-D-erythritol kinase [Arenicella chitinivorans]|uniref:4-diphosphocytidyl-2-C-methyl-D-erythritol kinase n=1 Tax=Arenicella chitinivorans TaxID=1329800 RepID=A0A918RRM1_9GAMM|nr:4-(cytidine 5'-diphospho)-2-C-methyl-D-erythritol kinase [Arenicella chitinivorans]GHA06638.1 4-diphosphocytidyl-2-C-methyl-D-erythritol kinase [Arenicella chitinivorans]
MAIDTDNRTWPAPAKINLFLHVTGKRSDGYHDLQTVFQFLDYGDELRFTITDNGAITRGYDLGFALESDLCLRAANLLKPLVTNNLGVHIDMIKRLPMGGGLGGGSSDAATVLLALNSLWKLGLTRTQLADIGLQLGADVPVFVHGHAAWAEGIGELLTPLRLQEPWYLVLIPPVSVSTGEIFSNKHLTATPQMKKIRALDEGDDVIDIETLLSLGDNQLEPIVRAEYPEVNNVLEWLGQHGNPRMTGSGGCVFMALSSQQQGLQLLADKPLNTAGFVAKGMNIHPLLMSEA